MFLKIIGGLVTALALAFVAGFVLPSQIHVERSVVIGAAPEQIFPLVSDLSQWDAWSPWAKKDPNAEMTISGSGLGQTMVWHSEVPEVGDGSQEVTALESPGYVKTHLDFGDMGVADAMISLTPEETGTRVAWSLDSDVREGVPMLMKPVSTYFGFMMDSMVGTEYENGLSSLKALVERA
ncbi:SRPBCC family protein [Leptothoe kymatousa]|uniref:SRPBCC family protein n=1 Tax=Leptothoe kymatousa TAU-MAC 1615 TaxID=2364775 RepID=A0ABS5Y6L1_9CYAN|nr:SRPBCC family protein [Leptothoe kymatousa]MBT9313458.1 SRPBCC family protein [Leptothoe kymatousa TAU-MAC 1615]